MSEHPALPYRATALPFESVRSPSWSEGLGGVQCATCWGNGRLYRDAPNGEGLIPEESCRACDGLGRIGE